MVHCYLFLGDVCVVICYSDGCFGVEARILDRDFVRLGGWIVCRLGINVLIYDVHLLWTHATIFFIIYVILDLNLIIAFLNLNCVRNINILYSCENGSLLMLTATVLMLEEHRVIVVSYDLLPSC